MPVAENFHFEEKYDSLDRQIYTRNDKIEN